MNAALSQFNANHKRAKDLVGLAGSLGAQTTQALDISDILRASLVLGVSALDHLIHEIARLGMIEVASGNRLATEAYHRFPVALKSASAYAANPAANQWLDAEIRARHGWQSFQDPDKIAEAIRLVCDKELWSGVGALLGMPARDVKGQLRLIVDRRNKIAHEADMDPTAPGQRWPIDAAIVSDALDFLESLAVAIITVVS
jgi:hypothetical protein